MKFWIQTASSFTVTPLSPVFPKLTSGEYLGVNSKEGVGASSQAPSNLLPVGTIAMLLSNILLMFLLTFRWLESGHFPLSNLYESLMFLSWSCTCIHLILEYKTSFKISRPDANLLTKLIGSITSPSALFTNAFATFSLPLEMQKASPLVPALQSNWLMMHVTVMIISYAALILGSLLSIAFLILINIKVSPSNSLRLQKTNPTLFLLPENKKQNVEQLVPPPFEGRVNSNSPLLAYSEQAELSISRKFLPTIGQEAFNLYNNNATQVGKIEKETLEFIGVRKSEQEEPVASFIRNIKRPVTVPIKRNLALLKSNLAWNFDNLSYRVVGIGFPFLTIGILSGAVWANEAWGSYWSWDPKETWALLTWLIFAIYLHARITKGWQGKKPAIIASFGFLAIWICFLGVNLIGEGLHSYGWFS